MCPRTTPKTFATLPANCAPGKRVGQRIRHRGGVALAPALSCLSTPNAKHVASSGDTRARGADRFHWSVLAPDQSHTVATGHTGRIARGRALAEAALSAFVDDWREQSGRAEWR